MHWYESLFVTETFRWIYHNWTWSQCEDDCSLTHDQLDDVVPIEMDPQNSMLGTSCLLLIFETYLRVNVIIHSWVIYTIFFFNFLSLHFEIDRNEIVADELLNDSVDNCRSKAKLINRDKLV